MTQDDTGSSFVAAVSGVLAGGAIGLMFLCVASGSFWGFTFAFVALTITIANLIRVREQIRGQ